MVTLAIDTAPLTTSARVTVHVMHIGRAKGEPKQNYCILCRYVHRYHQLLVMRCGTKVRIVWGRFRIAEAALKTST